MADLDNAPAEKVQPKEAAAESTVAQANIQSQQDGSYSKTFQDQNNTTAKASEQMAQNGTIGKMEIGTDSDGKYGSMDSGKAVNPEPKDSPRQDDGGSKDHRNEDNRSKDHNGKDGNLTKQGTLEQYPDRLEGGSAQGGAGGRHGQDTQPGRGGTGGQNGDHGGQSGGRGGQPGDRGGQAGGRGGFTEGRGFGQEGPVFDPRRDVPGKPERQGQYSGGQGRGQGW